uniref:Phospholipase-like, aminotransferase-like mobile domain protein n=1 Tax=Tanacetum cinerariifolium TaxID=118510 RepID=A0A699HND7_TANCI|nr:phospholipase-like, aminotransferase-like mobile domain protein [Tanacetum cinerariifolium]
MTTCFGPWLDIIYVENDDDGMIHYVLQKQCCSDDDNFDLPLIYNVNGHSLRFGRRQFCLLAGFKFGSINFCEYKNGDISFRNRLFPKKIGNVSSKHKLEHLAGLKRNSNHVLSYSLTGFLFAFKIVGRPKCWKSYREHCHRGERQNLTSMSILTSFFVSKKTLKKVVPQSEDYLQSTSEDELNIKDHTSPKEDDGNVYCYDDNGDVSLFFMPAKPVSQQTDQELSSNLYVLNGFCNNLSHTGEEKGDCEHYKYTYISKQEYQIIRLVDQRQQDHISNMAEDLLRPFKRIDKNFLSHELQVFLSRAVMGRCKFPWCNDITVDRSFWNGLSALHDNRKGWLLDETDMDWAMVISYFLPLLLQGSMPLFYVNNDIYSVP